MSDTINFFVEDIEFELDDTQSSHLCVWIEQVVLHHDSTIGALNFILVSDAYLLEKNVEHLNHDTLTDIITFPYVEGRGAEIQSDIYISIERVRENASEMNIMFAEELHRVMIHGVLHLVGFDDTDAELKGQMRIAEDFALSLRQF